MRRKHWNWPTKSACAHIFPNRSTRASGSGRISLRIPRESGVQQPPPREDRQRQTAAAPAERTGGAFVRPHVRDGRRAADVAVRVRQGSQAVLDHRAGPQLGAADARAIRHGHGAKPAKGRRRLVRRERRSSRAYPACLACHRKRFERVMGALGFPQTTQREKSAVHSPPRPRGMSNRQKRLFQRAVGKSIARTSVFGLVVCHFFAVSHNYKYFASRQRTGVDKSRFLAACRGR